MAQGAEQYQITAAERWQQNSKAKRIADERQEKAIRGADEGNVEKLVADTAARQAKKRGEGKHEKHDEVDDELIQKINERAESRG